MELLHKPLKLKQSKTWKLHYQDKIEYCIEAAINRIMKCISIHWDKINK